MPLTILPFGLSTESILECQTSYHFGMSDSLDCFLIFTIEYDKKSVERISTIIDGGIEESVDPSLTKIDIFEDSESSSITSIVKMNSSSIPSGQLNSLDSPS